MKFSIVIPVYNVEKYLRECLDSVLNQSFKDWEAICVNDGSTDGSAEILEEYRQKDKRMKVVCQANKGLSGARNTGMKSVNGEYILFLDSDDWIEKETLTILANELDDEDFLHFSARMYFMDDGSYGVKNNLMNNSYDNGIDYFNDNALQKTGIAFGYVCFRAWKTKFLRDFNLCFKDGIYFEDTLFTTIACYYAKKVKIINGCLYNYRIHNETITNDPAKRRKRRVDLIVVANELAKFYESKTGFDKTLFNRYINYQYQVSLMLLDKGDNLENKEVFSSCDWKSYKMTSRTKPRHRLNYWKNRIRYIITL